MLAFTDVPTTIPDITTRFLSPDSLVLTIFKIGFVLIALMYIVFSFVIVRQVMIMNRTVDTTLGSVIQIAAWIHLAIAIGFGFLIFLLL